MSFNPIEGILGAAESIFGSAFGSKSERDQAKADFKMALLGLNLGQIETNKEQAKHASIFVAGARPFIMWVCGFALLYKFILYPFLVFALVIFKPDFPIAQLPLIETGELMTVLLGMLGLGGMRTFEKHKGVARTHIK